MLDFHSSRRGKRGDQGLLANYGLQLGRIVERHLHEIALVAAKQRAERSAEIARIAMLTAEAASRAKSDFLENMSHELRTPLNAIMGFSDMMLTNKADKIADPDKFLGYARDINLSGKQLLDMVDDILTMTMIEVGQLDLEEAPVDIKPLVDSCVEAAEERINKGRVKIENKTPGSLPKLTGDEKKLRRVVNALLANGIKFTPDGGNVSIEVVADKSAGMTIVVADSGTGIAKEDLELALAPFWHGEGPFVRKYQGLGLGLPICKALVELHGGTLDIDSTVKVGTTVLVCFPAARIC